MGSQEVSVPLASPTSEIDPANPDNPFDEVGFHHNMALHFVRSIFGAENMLDDLKRVCDLGKEYFSQAGLGGQEFDSTKE